MAEEAAMMRSSAAQKQRIPSRSVEVKRSKRDASEADLSDRDDDDEKDQGDPGEEDDGDEEVADLAENEDGEEEEEQEEVAESSTSAARKAKKARTEASASKAKSKRKTPTAGIVYISRLPPGMTPQKVRHLMARWGDVGKVYAQRRDGYNPNAAAANKKQKHKHRQADFTEAWVEFLDKTMAKTVARMLNAQVIGGKKGDRWRDDIWTMKYLSGFKWEMLGEQVAYERQAHQARLRNEITRSRAEQGDYLRNVELARVLAKRKQKKLDAGGEVAPINNGEGRVSGGQSDKAEKDGQEGRGYRQREVVDRGKAAKGAGMDDVLSSVFG